MAGFWWVPSNSSLRTHSHCIISSFLPPVPISVRARPSPFPIFTFPPFLVFAAHSLPSTPTPARSASPLLLRSRHSTSLRRRCSRHAQLKTDPSFTQYYAPATYPSTSTRSAANRSKRASEALRNEGVRTAHAAYKVEARRRTHLRAAQRGARPHTRASTL
ncbi:hypothetical protein DFH06DRAFT_315001 [Mycena polygramma]|nr:hypothetical protein DFH06DRAFT_315001 [Mycena polygramma]